MDRHEQFRSAAAERGIPRDDIDRFARHLRFAISACTAEEGDEVVGRMGGLPELPVGMEWPGENGPLPFIGSVDCAALPRATGLPLPEDGSLLFFLHHEDDYEDAPSSALVLHVPADTETETAEEPPEEDTKGIYNCYDIPFLYPEEALTASVVPELPEWMGGDLEQEADSVRQLHGELEHREELVDLVAELWPETSYGLLHLGGYCRTIGGTVSPWWQMATDHFQSLRKNDPESWRKPGDAARREEEQRLIQEWVPLAQFPTADEVYYGCFLIRKDDLAARRFDRMRSFTMFTE